VAPLLRKANCCVALGAVSVRLDPQVLEWLRSKGEGHLTRINDILTNLMDAERRAGRDVIQ
jgi:uncharacterized protein (DUF4415 family)